MICSKAALSPAAARSTQPARAVWFRLGASSGNGISTARAICKAALGISATNRLPTLIYRPQEQNVENNYREFERALREILQLTPGRCESSSVWLYPKLRPCSVREAD